MKKIIKIVLILIILFPFVSQSEKLCVGKASFPQLVFIGENHKSPISIKVKKQLLLMAAKGHINLASEVAEDSPLFVGEENSLKKNYGSEVMRSKLYPLESKLLSSLLLTYLQQERVVYRKKTNKELLLNVLTAILQNDYFYQAYQAYLIKNPTVISSEQIASVMILISEGIDGRIRSREDIKVKFLKFFEGKSFNGDHLINFMTGIHMEIVDMLNSNSEFLWDTILPYFIDVKQSYEIGIHPVTSFFLSNSVIEQINKKREEFFFNQLNKVICDNDQKVLFVLLGNAHVRAIKSYVTESFENKIKSIHLRSDNFEQAQVINLLIQKAKIIPKNE